MAEFVLISGLVAIAMVFRLALRRMLLAGDELRVSVSRQFWQC